MKSQLNSPDQKRAIHTISDNSGLVDPISPLDDPLHPVYSPEKHPQMLHLVQQQSPEKIHFETSAVIMQQLPLKFIEQKNKWNFKIFDSDENNEKAQELPESPIG